MGYLFGSMHVRDQKTLDLAKVPLKALEKVDRLLLELDPAEMDFDELPQVLLLPGELRISTLLPARKYHRIRNRLLHRAGLDLNSCDRFIPLHVLNQVYESFFSSDSGDALDLHFFNRARELKVEVLGLEELHEQLDAVANVPIELQLRALDDLSRRYEHHRQKIYQMQEKYQKQNIHLLYQCNKKNLGTLRRSFIFKRNFLMTDRIDLHLKECKSMVVVGAGHLSGKYGLIRLLKSCGYQLKGVNI